MRIIPLTQGKVALVDDEDYDWLITWKWCAWTKRGKNPIFYAVTGIDYCIVHMHRLLCMYPKKPYVVDHINHNGIDNQKKNLRVVTNRFNVSHRRNHGLSKYTGVSRNNGKWRVLIQIDGENIPLGYFSNEYEAHLVYQERLSQIEKEEDEKYGK